MTENQRTIEELMKEIESLRGRIIEAEERAEESEKKLKEQELFTRIVMEHLPIGIAVNSVDPTVEFSYMNDKFAKFYRVKKEDLLPPNDFWQVVYQDPDSREKIKKRVMEDCASGDPARMVWEDVQVKRPGKDDFFISARNIPVPGKPFMISTVQDTTEYVQVMSALRESERQFRTLFENMSTGFSLHKIITNEAGEPVDYVFLAANPAFEKETGLKREDILGKRVTEILPGIENDPADWIHFYGQVALEGKAQTVERYSAVLKRWYSVVAYSPAPGLFAAVFSDISDRKRIEEETEKARTFLNAIINTIADPVFVKDSQHRWILLNDAFCEFMGHSREVLIGKSDYDFFPKEQAEVFWEKDSMVLESGADDVNEEKFTDAAGVEHTIVTKKSVFTLPWTSEKVLVGIIRDITDIRRGEEEKQKHLHELEVFFKASLGREERILELKKEINALRQQLETN